MMMWWEAGTLPPETPNRYHYSYTKEEAIEQTKGLWKAQPSTASVVIFPLVQEKVLTWDPRP